MKKVLIIEDETPITRALEVKLGDFNVLRARDGEEGLRTALSEHPDIILLDIVMPKMDGITMLKKMREDSWGRDVPVIILTNLADDAKLAEAMANGTHEYLIKSDWKIEDVVKKIKERLDKE